jgi:hypothetical protein
MGHGEGIDYSGLAEAHGPASNRWDEFVRGVLVDRWLAQYEASTPWDTEVIEVTQGELTFLFDAAPTLRGTHAGEGDDRVVAVWGHSSEPESRRDRARLRGFLPSPRSWSRRGHGRGHFVAHAAGGGLDLNLFPQGARLNRGGTNDGKLWRRMETHAARHPGTPLYVRPIYDTSGWTPSARLRAAC